jgi:hypothetical protein
MENFEVPDKRDCHGRTRIGLQHSNNTSNFDDSVCS